MPLCALQDILARVLALREAEVQDVACVSSDGAQLRTPGQVGPELQAFCGTLGTAYEVGISREVL